VVPGLRPLALAESAVSVRSRAAGEAPNRDAPASGHAPDSILSHLWLIPLFGCFVLILGVFHPRTNTSSPLHLAQADAFLAGRLDIDVEPLEYRYDLAYRDGKWFTYWGYVPAAAVVPFRWALGSQLTDRDVAIVLGLLTMTVWYAIVRRLPRLGLPPLRQWEVLALTFYCGFGQLTFNLTKAPVAAYTNHLFAFFFFSLSILFLLRPTPGRAVASTAMFCLAGLTRVSLFVIAPIFAVTLLAVTEGDWRFWKSRSMRRLGIAIGVIIGVSIVLQLYFNYLRFGDALDFGTALMPATYPVAPTYSVDYVAHNAWIYLISPVTYSLSRPFVRGASVGNALWSYQFGILVPVLAIAWRAKARRPEWFAAEDRQRRRSRILLGGLVAMWLAYFVWLLFYRFTGQITFGGRYLLDTQACLLFVIVVSYAAVRDQPSLRFGSLLCMLLSGVVEILSPQMLR
jgi:hypothetical protein